MIRSLYIDNFKSLVDFTLDDIGKFTVVVGLNGAGKSSLLHAFDFIQTLVTGDVDAWLSQREWTKADITSRFMKKQVIAFRLRFHFAGAGDVVWEGKYNPNLMRCTSETIKAGGRELLGLSDGLLSVRNAADDRKVELDGLAFKGSSLSVLVTQKYHSAVDLVKGFVSGLKALDLLSPKAMRRRAKTADDIGPGGEKLSAFIHGLDLAEKDRLLDRVKTFYGTVCGLESPVLPAGWKDLRVLESWTDASGRPLSTSSRLINDGLLRVLAIVAQTLATTKSATFMLFDEIENGINPELTERLVSLLMDIPEQIMVTTHSPMILNWIPDDIAKESVIFVYRSKLGYTRAIRFFDIPLAAQRLALLGPGEVFADVNLYELAQQLSEAEV